MYCDDIESAYANVFPELRKDLVDRLKSLNSPPLVIQRLEEVRYPQHFLPFLGP